MGGAGLAGGAYWFFVRTVLGLFGEGMKNPDYGTVGG